MWSMCKQYVQRREVSDHCALVVKSVDKDWVLNHLELLMPGC